MKIRIGKELHISWSILTQGENKPLEGRDLRLYLQDPNRRRRALEFTTDANTLLVVIPAKTLTRIGKYALILTENEGQEGQTAVDANPSFTLVETTREEDTNTTEAPNLDVATINLATGNLTLRMVLQELFSGKDGGDMKTGDILPVLRDGELHRVSAKIGAGSGTGADCSAEIEALTAKVEENTANIASATSVVSDALTTAQDAQTVASSASDNATQAKELATEAKTTAEIIEGKADDAITKATEAAGKADAAEKAAKGAQTSVTTLEETLRAAILELRMSIPCVKAFIVETGSEAGYYMVDGKRVDIQANTRMSVTFTTSFSISEIWKHNPGIIGLNTTFTNTDSLTSMFCMFFGCSSLTSIDVSGFYTSAVLRMDYMFYSCKSLTSVDLSSFDTSSVTYMSQMFFDCSSLTSLDLSSFDTSSLIYMEYMFFGCLSLTSLDLSSFDTSSVTSINQMFGNLQSLTSLLLGPNFFKASDVTTISFSDCQNWTNDTVITSLVTNSYNRASAGLNTLTLQLHENTKASLTDEQKATITSKGYTIA